MAGKYAGKQVNRSHLAETFGVALPTVDAWVKKGVPVVTRGGRGQEWVFDTAAVARWLRDQAAAEAGGKDDDLDEIEKRTKRAKMRSSELELAKAQGLVAEIGEFERTQAVRAAMVRQNVMNVAQRACLRLLGETDETTFKRTLREELTLALRTAYETPVELPDEEPDSDES